jgi:hypothetical protein
MQDSGGSEAYMEHIKKAASSSHSAAQEAPGTQAAVDPLKDGGKGNLFWDIVEGRVDVTPPPVGDLEAKDLEAKKASPAQAATQLARIRAAQVHHAARCTPEPLKLKSLIILTTHLPHQYTHLSFTHDRVRRSRAASGRR